MFYAATEGSYLFLFSFYFYFESFFCFCLIVTQLNADSSAYKEKRSLKFLLKLNYYFGPATLFL